MSEYIVDTFGIVQDFADLHGDMSTPLYQAIMDVMLSRQHEEIVRCRDCACWYRGYCGRHSYEVANEYGDTYTEGLFPMDEDDFCSLGERMEGSE